MEFILPFLARIRALWFNRFFFLHAIGLSALAFLIVTQPPAAIRATEKPFLAATPVEGRRGPLDSSSLYLPLVLKGPQPPFLIGVYHLKYNGSQQVVDDYLHGLDEWAGLSRSAGKGHTIAADFVSFDFPNLSDNIMAILETLWSNGYTAFFNIYADTTAAAITNAQYDSAIRAWARAYKAWLDLGGNRRAFLAPLQEMNGYWVPYGLDPTNFKPAFRRIVTIFGEEGVTRDKVWWTFAPNGYSEGTFRIKDYYPGDDVVDVIAFSAYNFGKGCAQPWTWWQEPDEAFGPYIAEIRQTVSRAKPIFIAETASSSFGGDKDQWLRNAYAYLNQQNVRGVLYLNADKECDWAVYVPGGRQVQGYRDAVSSNAIRYIPPATLSVTDIPP
jgi:hypothetical protein